ncbi:MAG: hypothetical protein ACXABY_08540 [Candidatus Thorarchaeota archaeon]|jgi:hypothetical protein
MTNFLGYADAPTCEPGPTDSKAFVIRGRADFGKHNCAATDNIQICTIPAGVMLIGGLYKCTVAEGSAGTIDVGDAAGAQDFSAGLDANSAGNWTKMGTAPLTNSDTFFEIKTDTVVYVEAVAALSHAVIDFIFWGIGLHDYGIEQ